MNKILHCKKAEVSIPFQRESPFGPKVTNAVCKAGNFLENTDEFQFPSNGKVLSDRGLPEYKDVERVEFQFPSNGKVLSDFATANGQFYRVSDVSIPFQRESPFGLRNFSVELGIDGYCFNSLPTGKSFRTK